MSNKQIAKGHRPDSANTETTRLTLPSETSFSLTTNSAFKSSQTNNQFDDSNLQTINRPGSMRKKNVIVKQEEKKQKQKEKQQYEKMISRPIKKNSAKDEEKKITKDPKNIQSKAKPFNKNGSKIANAKHEQPKPAINNAGVKENQPKFDYSNWKYNGKTSKSLQKPAPPEKTQQEKKSEQKAQMMKFINEMQLKNMDFLLNSNYQISIENAARKINNGSLQGLQQWNSNLENQFSDFKFHNILKTIQENQKQLENEEKVQTTLEKDSEQQPSIMNMTLSDLQQRNNLFLTEINKDKKLTAESISTLQVIQKSQQKIQQFEKQQQKQQEDENSQEEEETTKKTKNPITSAVQRNIVSVSNPYFQCDYLPSNYKQRLTELLQEIQSKVSNTPNPFVLSEEVRRHIKLIDQGIMLSRKSSLSEAVIDQKGLPGDPELRKEAELKILKSRLQEVNRQLLQINKGSVSKQTINKLVNKLKQQCLIPKSKIIQTKKLTLQQLSKKSEVSSQFLKTVNSRSKQIQQDLDEIKAKLQELQSQITRTNKLSAEELRQQQIESLCNFRQKVSKLQQQIEKLPASVEELSAHASNLKEKIHKIQQQFGEMRVDKIEVPDFKSEETIEDINKVIENKIQSKGRNSDS